MAVNDSVTIRGIDVAMNQRVNLVDVQSECCHYVSFCWMFRRVTPTDDLNCPLQISRNFDSNLLHDQLSMNFPREINIITHRLPRSVADSLEEAQNSRNRLDIDDIK